MVAPIKLRPEVRPAHILAISLVVLPLGCSGAGAGEPASSYEISSLPSIDLLEELRIGSVDDVSIGFVEPGQVVIAENGDVFVFENRAREIRRYSASGDLLGTIGRRGSGPGEFERPPFRLGVWDETVWTFDIGSRRWTSFTKDGTVGSVLTLAEVTPLGMLDDGRLIAEQSTGAVRAGALARGGAVALSPVEETAGIPIVAVGSDGSVRDTIRWRAAPPARRVPALLQGSPPLFVPGPPADTDLDIQLSDGWLTIERPTPSSTRGLLTIRRHDLSGDTLFSNTYLYDAPENDAAYLDSTARQSVSAMASAYAAGAAAATGARVEPPTVDPRRLEQVRSAMDFPPFRPLIQSYVAGKDGSIWLRREEGGVAHDRWMLIDADGIPRGVVDLRPSDRIAAASGETMWLFVLDEYDVPWLVRYRLQMAR